MGNVFVTGNNFQLVAASLPPLHQRPEEMHMFGMQYIYQKFHES
jgi:hypothetical protein